MLFLLTLVAVLPRASAERHGTRYEVLLEEHEQDDSRLILRVTRKSQVRVIVLSSDVATFNRCGVYPSAKATTVIAQFNRGVSSFTVQPNGKVTMARPMFNTDAAIKTVSKRGCRGEHRRNLSRCAALVAFDANVLERHHQSLVSLTRD